MPRAALGQDATRTEEVDTAMFWAKSEDALSEQWRREGQEFIAALNEFVQVGLETNWEGVKESDEPRDPRQPLAKTVLKIVRDANKAGDISGLREKFPPAYEPFIKQLGNAKCPADVLLLEDGRILARVGAPHEKGHVALLSNSGATTVPGTFFVGRSPNREFFAVAKASGVSVTKGWDGPVVAELGWPTGLEGVPSGYDAKQITPPPSVTQLFAFDDGKRALLVANDGVFVLEQERTVRLLPTQATLKESFEFQTEKYPGDDLTTTLDMEHGALSPDGKYIACGQQDGKHRIFDATTYERVAEVGPHSEYPHYAFFSSDSTRVALSACHLYGGATICVETKHLHQLDTEHYAVDDRLGVVQDGPRIHSGVFRGRELILGDINGYLRGVDFEGKEGWRHFIGGPICTMDLSVDRKTLVLGTSAGIVSVIDLDAGKRDAYTIGTSRHRERSRWVFWNKDGSPLRW